MSESFEPLNLSNALDRPGPPPLRIHHFLAVTVVAAVLLSVGGGLRQNEAVVLLTFFRSGLGIAYIIATAVAVTLVTFGVRWRLNGSTFFDQPGHWLLVERALGVTTFLLAALVAGFDLTTEYGLIGAWFALISLISCGVGIWAAIRVADTWLWRIVFIYTSFVTLGLPFAVRIGGGTSIAILSIASSTVSGVLLFAAATSDWVAGRLRDWPHWVGVLMRLSLTAVVLVQYIWMWWAMGL